MDNILTYIKFRKDIPFDQQPFNEADAVAFALLVGINLEGLIEGRESLSSVAEKFIDHGILDDRDDQMFYKVEMLRLMKGSVRFGNVMLENFVRDISEAEEKTFYGLTAYLTPHRALVIFRGTDGSLLSWKENFCYAYRMPSPGQLQGLEYLTAVIKQPFVHASVIGHSKGGGLAVYSAMCLSPRLQRKLDKVYCFDGPGFMRDVSRDPGFLAIKDKIEAFVPTYCLVGNLLKTPFDKQAIVSQGKGVYQHDLFNWTMDPSGPELTEGISRQSRSLALKLNGWLEKIPVDERKEIVDELFDAFADNNIHHITDLLHMDIKQIIGILLSAKRISPENKELIGIVLKEIRKQDDIE